MTRRSAAGPAPGPDASATFARAVLDRGSEAMVVVDAAAHICWANRAAEHLLGYAADALLGRCVLDLVHPDDLGLAVEAFGTTTNTGAGVKDGVEVRVVDADGAWQRVAAVATNLLDDPDVAGILLVLRQLDAMPGLADRQQSWEQRFVAAFENAPMGRAIVSREGRVVRVNRRLAELTARAPEDLINITLTDLLPGAPALEEIANDSVQAETNLESPEQGTRRLGVTVNPMTGADHEEHDGLLNVFVEDITDLRAAEARLRSTQDEFRALVSHSSDIITVLEPDGSWRSSSTAASRVLGFPADDELEGGVFSLLHPDDVEVAQSALTDLLAGERGPDDALVLRVRHYDDSRWIYLETNAQDLVDHPAVRGIVLNSRDITERVTAERELRAVQERFRSLAQHVSDVITVVDAEATISYASPSMAQVLGYDPAEVIGMNALDLIHPEDQDRVFEASAKAIDDDVPAMVEYRTLTKSGDVRVFEAITTDLTGEPSVAGFVTNARDVTERRAAERQAARLIEVLEKSNEVVVLSEPSGRLVYSNPRAKEFLGLGDEHDVGELSSFESRERLRDEVMPLVRAHGLWTGELTLRTSEGNDVPVIATLQAHREDSEIVLISTLAHDITDLKRAQHRLEYEATHDALTGLPNRSMFLEVGEQALGRAQRHDATTAVLFLDLDGFKEVNDSLGHDAGDRVLVDIARNLRVSVRAGDLVARLGGDEFCVLCENVESREEMLELGERVCNTVSLPMSVLGREVKIGASIGVAFDTAGETQIGNLLRQADVALYRAKRAGGYRVELADPSGAITPTNPRSAPVDAG